MPTTFILRKNRTLRNIIIFYFWARIEKNKNTSAQFGTESIILKNQINYFCLGRL